MYYIPDSCYIDVNLNDILESFVERHCKLEGPDQCIVGQDYLIDVHNDVVLFMVKVWNAGQFEGRRFNARLRYVIIEHMDSMPQKIQEWYCDPYSRKVSFMVDPMFSPLNPVDKTDEANLE